MTGGSNNYVAIVDDDESVCRSLARLLHTAGFHAITYPSGEAFFQDLKRPNFDCLLLDIGLTGMSGLELRRRLSSVNDTTPVIFITARDEPDERAVAEGLGCAGFFRKTDPGSAILDLINHIADPSPTPPPMQATNPDS